MRKAIIPKSASNFFPEEFFSQSDSDLRRKVTLKEQVPDPTPLPMSEDDKDVVTEEDKEVFRETDFDVTQSTDEERECCISVKTGSCGCVHITTDEEEPAEIQFKKSPRQKFIDKVKSKIASVGVYGRRINFGSKFIPKKGEEDREEEVLNPSLVPWMPADTKQREKKIPHKEKRSQRVAVAKMKITGPPVQEDFSIEESLPDVE